MNKNFIGVGIIAILFLLVIIFLITQNRTAQIDNNNTTPQQQISPTQVNDTEDEARPSDEEAELVGFQFIQDIIAQGPPNPDLRARDSAYQALSASAREKVSKDFLGRDLALFVGIQDVPDQGASVEDLQIEGNTAALIVGLNYSGGRVLRAVNMVVENGEWKVDSIDSLDNYPSEN